jgi:hypothetical protein
MKTFCAALLPLFLATSCTLFTERNVIQSVEYTCASATALLKTATALQDKISPANQAKIGHAITVLNPICSQEMPPTLDNTARAALSSALAELTAAVPPQ